MAVERLRFHLDEHIDQAIARALRASGIDVTTTTDAGLRTSTDDIQLSFAISNARVFVTDDTDFLALAAERQSHGGIVICHRRTRTLGEIVRTLVQLHRGVTPESMKDRILHVQRESR